MVSRKSNEASNDILVRVRVVPGARKEKVEEREGILCVSVREKAEGNRATARIKEVVALRYRVPLTQVRIMTGARSPSKLIRVST